MVSKTKKPPEIENDNLDSAELPDYLKNQVAGANDAESMIGGSKSIPRISLRGKKFRVIVAGEEILKPSLELKVVILAVEPKKGLTVKTFYAGGFDPNDTAPPDCSSQNGETPDEWINDPVSFSCKNCPKNIFGSAESRTGKKAKACKDSKMLHVAIVENEKNQDLGLGMGGIVFQLGVPVTSLTSLSDYAKDLIKRQFPLPGVVTKLTMNDESDFPVLEFDFGGFLPESDAKIAIDRNVSRDFLDPGADRLLGYDPEKSDKALVPVDKKPPKTLDAKPGDIDTVVGDWQ